MAELPRVGWIYIGRRPNAKRRLVVGSMFDAVLYREQLGTARWDHIELSCKLTTWRRWDSGLTPEKGPEI